MKLEKVLFVHQDKKWFEVLENIIKKGLRVKPKRFDITKKIFLKEWRENVSLIAPPQRLACFLRVTVLKSTVFKFVGMQTERGQKKKLVQFRRKKLSFLGI